MRLQGGLRMRIGVSLTSGYAVSDGRAGARYGELVRLPVWNPVLVAEQAGTLATPAPGRFNRRAGLGYDEPQCAAMGTAERTRPSAFEESLGIVRRLLAGEVVSSSGRF